MATFKKGVIEITVHIKYERGKKLNGKVGTGVKTGV